MSVGVSTAPYLGRTIDLLAFQGLPQDGEALLTQALASAGESGAVVTGVHKLAQRFLLELLTAAGSMPYTPDRGCQFMPDAVRGTWRTAADVEQSFHSSLVDVRRNLQREESSADPDDERFASAALSSVVLGGGSVAIYVAVTSLAGTTRVVIAPLNFTV